jgi:hypothetical protein
MPQPDRIKALAVDVAYRCDVPGGYRLSLSTGDESETPESIRRQVFTNLWARLAAIERQGKRSQPQSFSRRWESLNRRKMHALDETGDTGVNL